MSPSRLSVLVPIIGNARVIGLAEPPHGAHEFLALRNALVRYLVENEGVTAIAAETGFTESTVVDDYIMGRGGLDSGVVGGVFAWGMAEPLDDNRALVEWLRTYNASASTKRKVHFYGLDLTGGRGGRFVEARRAIDAALSYVATVDTAAANTYQATLGPMLSRFKSFAYDSLTTTEQTTFTAAIADLASLMERRAVTWTAHTSVGAYQRARHDIAIAGDLNANFRSAHAESNPQVQREAAMARSLGWVLDQEGSGGRVFLFEANWHVSKGPMWTDRFGSGLGEFLRTFLGDDYVAIGGTYGHSPADFLATPDSASLAAALAGTHQAMQLLDLRTLPKSGPVADWFAVQRPLVGGRTDVMLLSQAFDAIVYVDSITPAADWKP